MLQQENRVVTTETTQTESLKHLLFDHLQKKFSKLYLNRKGIELQDQMGNL